jgi:hypothetical protein
LTDTTNEPRDEALARFCHVAGIPQLTAITQRGRDPETARFTFHFADGQQVRIGTIKTLWSQAELAKVLAVTVGCVPEPVKAADWRTVLAVLIRDAVNIEEVTGEDFQDSVREWLERYLAGHGLEADHQGAAAHGLPHIHEGELYVTASHLAKYIRREYSENVTLVQLRTALTDLGLQRQTVMFNKAGKRSSTSYYVGPENALQNGDGA